MHELMERVAELEKLLSSLQSIKVATETQAPTSQSTNSIVLVEQQYDVKSETSESSVVVVVNDESAIPAETVAARPVETHEALSSPPKVPLSVKSLASLEDEDDEEASWT